MAPSSRLPRRAGWVLAALAAPWLVYACDLAPLGPGASGTGGSATTTTSSAASSAGTTASSSTTSSSTGTGGATPDAGDAGGDGDAGDADLPCNTTIVAYPFFGANHVADCSPLSFASNPPTSGDHYQDWAAFKTYTTPVPRGFYVHDMEHGAVVILYNCPSGCDADLAQLAAWLDARPADPLCVPPVKSRVVVTPDPLIPTRFAAAAWEWALTSDCFDMAALGAFMDAHYGMGPEVFCTQGTVDPSVADAGIPDGCGEGDGG